MVSGSIVAIVTPMHEDGRIDTERFRSLIDWHIKEGTDGIVVVNDAYNANPDSVRAALKALVDMAAGRGR